jgi:hypothetical protein
VSGVAAEAPEPVQPMIWYGVAHDGPALVEVASASWHTSARFIDRLGCGTRLGAEQMKTLPYVVPMAAAGYSLVCLLAAAC